MAETKAIGSVRLAHAALTRNRAIAFLAVVGPVVASGAGLTVVWQRGLIGPMEIGLFAFFYLLAGLGITLGFHRLFSHRSFVASQPLEAALAIAGSLTVQGPIIRWVADHRRHHRFSDRPGDPHSPHLGRSRAPLGRLRSFWWAHAGWLFDRERTLARVYAPDLLANPLVRWVDRHYLLWVGVSLAAPAALGLLIGGTTERALSAFILAGPFRVLAWQHVTWSINSVCHCFGTRPYRSRDRSANNPGMAVLALGEGWHNNHHAFPNSARHGLETRQLDLTWIALRGLAALGQATDLRCPSSEQRAKRRRNPAEERPPRAARTRANLPGRPDGRVKTLSGTGK